jgi:hypothetical protein
MSLVSWAFLALFTGVSWAGPLRDAAGLALERELAAAQHFPPAELPARPIATSREELLAFGAVCRDTARFMRAHPEGDPALGPGLVGELGPEWAETLATLEGLATLIEADRGAAQPRLLDPAFLPDRVAAQQRGLSLPADQLRLTRYIVRSLNGRLQPQGEYQFALYADPGPGQRERFTREQVLNGAWTAGGASPLIYLTEAGVHDAILQGTVAVNLPDGQVRMFNVDQHNGIPYQPGVKNPRQQRRYWYFREVDSIRGYGQGEDKITLAPRVVVAGDVNNLGLGRVMLIESQIGLHWVVLADTGGAFSPNLHQLDLLAGVFASRADLATATRSFPETTRVHLLRWVGEGVDPAQVPAGVRTPEQ